MESQTANRSGRRRAARRTGSATVWLMHGCGLRIGEALAVNLRCLINNNKTLRARDHVNPAGQLRPLKFRRPGELRDIQLPQYLSEAIDKRVADHGITAEGYLFQGRRPKLVIRRSYQQDFQRAAARAACHRVPSRTHCATWTPPTHWLRESRSPKCPAGSATPTSRAPTRSPAT